MSAPQAIRNAVHIRAGGRCECTMTSCRNHTGRCSAMLRGPWEVHRRAAGGAYTLTNVVGMCQTCHRNTRTYGRGRL